MWSITQVNPYSCLHQPASPNFDGVTLGSILSKRPILLGPKQEEEESIISKLCRGTFWLFLFDFIPCSCTNSYLTKSPLLTALEVWIRIRTHFFLTCLPLNHTQSVPMGFNSLLTTMKEVIEIYNP